jgi:hypothetical protein
VEHSVGWTALGDPFSVSTFGAVNSVRIPAYHRLDARMSRRFPVGRGMLTVFLDVFNIYDRDNALGLDH